MTQIATLVVVLGILGLFLLDRDRQARTSPALWLPMAWLAICASRPVWAWLGITPVGSIDQYLEGSPLDRAVLTALLVAGLIVLVKRGGIVTRLVRANAPVVMFLLYGFVSIVWSDYSDVAFKRWIKALGELVMVGIILTDPEPVPALKRVLAWPAFLLLPLSILFIKYYPDLGRGYRFWTWSPYYTGVTMDKNMLGMVCMIFGLASMWCVCTGLRAPKSSRRTRSLMAQTVVLVTALWLLLKADSMTSFSCFLLGSILIVATSFPALARKRAAIHLLVVVLVLAAFSVLFLGLDPGVLDMMGKNPTLTGRTDIWAVVLHLTVNPLFGAGFESFWLGPRLDKIWGRLLVSSD